jgi:TraM recognition site of TraD and TraG
MPCVNCGYEPVDGNPALCPLCNGNLETWELMWPALPLEKNRDQVAAWISQLPHPIAIDINVVGGEGMRIRLHAPRGSIDGAITAWASMNHQQSHFVRSRKTIPIGPDTVWVLRSSSILPNLVVTETRADPLLAIGGRLLSGLLEGQETGLRIWLIRHDPHLQAKIRELASYSYGTAGGIDNQNAPNPWGLELGGYKLVVTAGMLIAAGSAALSVINVIPILGGVVGFLTGISIFTYGALGVRKWMQWRSIPKEILDARVADTIVRTTIVAYGVRVRGLSLLSGVNQWDEVRPEWPAILPFTLPLPSQELAALITPPELGEGGGILARSSISDVPAAFPSRSLIMSAGDSKIRVGSSVSTGEPIGIDPDGHVLVAGGTRSGKSSFTYDVLKQLILRGEDAPGIFLVDPHLSLSDAFLQEVNDLPGELREKAIQRLRIITTDQREVIPLNLLTLPEYSWAGNAIVQVGRRIWDDYWGPRMQAALLGLFRLAHVWNQQENHPDKLGLIHVVFSAFNTEWRHDAMALLPPIDRLGSLGLDALLGQFSGSNGRWDQSWVTEVISPVLSKVMALELSPWLFSALHQKSFAPLDQWIKDKAWVVLRLPSGEMGREAARLTAGVVYNVFDAIYHRVALENPIPFYFIIDEAQEIAAGMRLESMLSEGAKFGARMFVLTQSLTMMRQIEGFEPVVQALLANTSTQAFFSADPEDAEIINSTLNTTARFGVATLDLPTLQCWLRARIGGRWQSPALLEIAPLVSPGPGVVQSLIREVITAHPDDYVLPKLSSENAVQALVQMIPKAQQGLLSLALAAEREAAKKAAEGKSNLDQEKEAARPIIQENLPEEKAHLGKFFLNE